MNPLPATVEITIKVDRTVTFERIVPIDLSSIFTGYGPLPAVTGTTNQVGAWDMAGQTRTVTLSDGSSAQELLTSCEHPSYFAYNVRGFTGVLRFFTTSADGEWWFSDAAAGHTHIKWRYAFHPRSVFAVPFLWFIATVLWRNYMQKALQLSKCQIEHGTA